jgi:hypothetical protein
MDGVFVAYHNTREIFGFQYLSREFMDELIYGNSATGDASFALILQMYNDLLAAIVPQFASDATIRLTFNLDKSFQKLTIFAEDIKQTSSDTIASNSLSFHQFVLKSHSTLNGLRSDQVTLNPGGNDDKWEVHYTINQVKPENHEFELARRKTTEIKGSIMDDDGMGRDSVFAKSMLKSIQKQKAAPKAIASEIIAPWAML